MKSSLFTRWRVLAIGILVGTISSAAWWGVSRLKHQRAFQSIREDLRLTDAGESPIDPTPSHSNVCEIHGVEMYVGAVPVIYGLVERPLRDTLSERVAPHAYWTAAGGCIVRSSSSVARTYICPECVRHATDMTYSYWQPDDFLPKLDFPRLK
jgi:hypothetical protein